MAQHLQQADEEAGADVTDVGDAGHGQVAALDNPVRQPHTVCGRREGMASINGNNE